MIEDNNPSLYLVRKVLTLFGCGTVITRIWILAITEIFRQQNQVDDDDGNVEEMKEWGVVAEEDETRSNIEMVEISATSKQLKSYLNNFFDFVNRK